MCQENRPLDTLFSYDASGNVVSVKFNGTEYYYLRNGQGDVVKLIDGDGNTVVEYTYNTWGKAVTTTGSLAGTLGLFQPFRYRGYVYDWETGFYYLQSRYYDPTTGRFISADVLLSTGQGVLGHNCYAYCLGNPVSMVDDGGTAARDLTQVSAEGSNGYFWLPPSDSDPSIWEDLVAHCTALNTTVKDNYISIKLEPWSNVLKAAIKHLGIKNVSMIMAETANSKYKKVYNKGFPLNDQTIAKEIKFHINGYFNAKGESGYFWKKSPVLYLFTIERIVSSCRSIDINYNDIYCTNMLKERGWWDATLFGYRKGLRTEDEVEE